MAKKPTTPLDRIAALLKARGMSEAGAAVAAGLNRAYLARRRIAGGELDHDAIAAFAGVLKVPVGELLGETPAPAEGGGLVAAAAADIVMLSFDQLRPSKLNPRKTLDSAAIDELAASIAAQGLLQNLVVRPGRGDNYTIIAGYRRFEAIGRLLELGKWDRQTANIPARIRDVDDAEHLALALLENLMREDVNPMEEAEAFAALQALDPKKWAPAQIALKIGTSTRHVQLRLALTRTSPAVQKALKEGQINLAMARTLTMLPPSKQAAWVGKGKEYATAEQLRDNITQYMIPTDRAKFDVASSGAKIMTDPDSGKSWFTDREEFVQLQKKQATKILAQLRKEWAWAQRVDHFFASEYEKQKSDDRTKAGAIVEVNWEGIIKVHTGLVKAKTKSAQKRAEQRAEQDARQQSRILGEHLTRDLGAAAVDNQRFALMFYLFNQITCDDFDSDGIPAAAVTRALGSAVLPFVEKTVLDDMLALKEAGDGDPALRLSLWQTLDRVPLDNLAQAVALCLAERVDIRYPEENQLPLYRAMCASAGVNFPEGELEEIPDDDEPADDGQGDIEDAAAEAAAE